jgi:hypothetical protein
MVVPQPAQGEHLLDQTVRFYKRTPSEANVPDGRSRHEARSAPGVHKARRRSTEAGLASGGGETFVSARQGHLGA